MKTLLCFLLSALCLSAHGQAVLRSAFLQSFRQTESAPPATCAFAFGNTGTTNDTSVVTANWSQVVSNAITPCEVRVYVGNSSGGDQTVYCSVWTAANKGGSQVGSDSVTVTATNGVTGWLSFTWSGAAPTLSDGNHLTWTTSGTLTAYGSAANAYGGTTECLYLSASGYSDNDAAFQVWTLQ
jgi:hypothetical protein